VYYLDEERVWDTIVDNKAYITSAVTKYEKVKAYVWLTKENTERENDTDFRTKLFELKFFENENADGVVPTEEQVDGFNTILTAMNRKIDEVNALETTIEQEEADRQQAEISREERTNEAINNIVDMTAEYNANAQAKTEEFNQNAAQETTNFNNNYTQKMDNFNDNASIKTLDFNTNAENKTDDFNENAITQTQNFDSHVEVKTEEFDANAQEKTDDLNDIAEGIEDMTTAIQFATFEVDDDMHLNIIQAERLKNTNFIFNPETGRLGVRIYNG
jgi:hypothetical protein